MDRRALVVIVLAIVSAIAVRGAGGSTTLRPPAGTPDPKLMVLTASDLGAKVKRQRYYKDTDFPSLISYERYLGPGRFGKYRLLYTATTAEIGTSETSTTVFLASLRRLLGTKQARDAITRGFTQELGNGRIFVSKLHVGRPLSLGVGNAGSFDLPMSVQVLKLPTNLHLAVFRVERVLGAILVVGAPGVKLPVAGVARLAKLMVARATGLLIVPANVSPPTISGTAQAGQTLTAAPGTWTGAAPGFAYQWERCDETGANCTDVPGATSAAYVVQDTDVGATLRVKVTAANVLGTATVESAPTAVVTPSPPPPPSP
jgi:hypothetical protein